MPQTIDLPMGDAARPNWKLIGIGGVAGLGLLVYLMSRNRSTSGGATTSDGQLTLSSAVALGSIQSSVDAAKNALSFFQQEQGKSNESILEGVNSVGGLVTHDIRAGDLQQLTNSLQHAAEMTGWVNLSSILQAVPSFRSAYDKALTDVGLPTWTPTPDEVALYNRQVGVVSASSDINHVADTIAARVWGGPAVAGHMYRTNERGVPELFVPAQDGTILPNERLRVLASAEDFMDEISHTFTFWDAGPGNGIFPGVAA